MIEGLNGSSRYSIGLLSYGLHKNSLKNLKIDRRDVTPNQ